MLLALRDLPSEPICLVSIGHLAIQLASSATHTSSSPPSGIMLFSIRRSSPPFPNRFQTTSRAILPSHLPSYRGGSQPRRMQVVSP